MGYGSPQRDRKEVELNNSSAQTWILPKGKVGSRVLTSGVTSVEGCKALLDISFPMLEWSNSIVQQRAIQIGEIHAFHHTPWRHPPSYVLASSMFK